MPDQYGPNNFTVVELAAALDVALSCLHAAVTHNNQTTGTIMLETVTAIVEETLLAGHISPHSNNERQHLITQALKFAPKQACN